MSRRGPREVEILVDNLTAEGFGEGRYAAGADGAEAAGSTRTVRARNALPGEVARVRVLKRRQGIWFGEAHPQAAEAPDRRRPACPHYPRCGGCALQHLDYDSQLRHKAGLLTALLAQQGVVAGRTRPPVAGPRFHYRFKARLGARLVGDQVLVGFREGFSSRVARLDDCKILALPFARALPALKAAIGRFSEPSRVPQVELAGGDREFAVIVRHLYPLPPSDISILEAFGAQTGIRVHLQAGGYDTVRPLQAGTDPYLSYSNPELGLCFQFRPTDFTQVNPDMNRALQRSVLLALDPLAGATVADLFCGIGNFSLAVARGGGRVWGFESVAGAVERADHNAELNGLEDRAEFAVADLYDARCPELPQTDSLLLDPPRSGAGVNLERWVAPSRLKKVVYVSCNPGTFASDAARLIRMGFVLQEVGIFDMFPHTAHVETLGLFERDRVPAHG